MYNLPVIVFGVFTLILGICFMFGKGISRQTMLKRHPNWTEQDILKSARSRGILLIICGVILCGIGMLLFMLAQGR